MATRKMFRFRSCSICLLFPFLSLGFENFIKFRKIEAHECHRVEKRISFPETFYNFKEPIIDCRGGARTSPRLRRKSRKISPLYSVPDETIQQNQLENLGTERIKRKTLLGFEYLATGFILGVVVVGMEINLVDFAKLCNVPTEKASLALLWRSGGSMVGAALAGPLMEQFHPHRLAFGLLSIIGGLLFGMPTITALATLNSSFFGFGAVVSVINTAILLLLRQVFEDGAGVWLQGLSVTFQFGVIAVPALAKYFALSTQYTALAAIAFSIMAVGLVTAKPKALTMDVSAASRTTQTPGKKAKQVLTGIDMLIAGANFFLVGIIVNTMTYLRPYMTGVGLDAVLNPKDALLGVTLSVLCGQVFSMVTQQRGISLEESYLYLKGFHAAAVAALASMILAPVLTARHFILCGVGLFGAFWGPLIGYMYDVWNRRTKTSALGTAFVTFGGAVGCGLYPFGTYAMWKRFGNPNILFLSNIAALIVSIALICLTKANPIESKKTAAVPVNAPLEIDAALLSTMPSAT